MYKIIKDINLNTSCTSAEESDLVNLSIVYILLQRKGHEEHIENAVIEYTMFNKLTYHKVSIM